MAWRLTPEQLGQRGDRSLEDEAVDTLTHDLWALSDWLTEAGMTHVAMERTGESWQPVDNLLAGTCMVFLVNAAQVKNVPGRQTDRAEARWLAILRRHGLLQASF